MLQYFLASYMRVRGSGQLHSTSCTTTVFIYASRVKKQEDTVVSTVSAVVFPHDLTSVPGFTSAASCSCALLLTLWLTSHPFNFNYKISPFIELHSNLYHNM
jgi:hypothetical protein